MSGIVGMVNPGVMPVDEQLLRLMTGSLAHRGPDKQQTWLGGPVGFGHTLLSTTTESEDEEQPASLDGQVWITADARVDGRAELVDQLASLGRHGLREASDAELILHAYHAWAENCVEHLLGDFAFGIWDGPARLLFCARDHFGVKPFYYAQGRGAIVFSNSLDCVRLHPEVGDSLNELAIGDFLLFGFNQDPTTTTFGDVHRLPPAHSLTAREGALRFRQYWTLPTNDRIRYRRSHVYVDRFQEILSSAVDDRLRTSPVGVWMSGGLDSTAVAATARRLGSRRSTPVDLHAHTVVYDALIPDEERHHAGIAAKALGVHPNYMIADGYGPFDGWDQPGLLPPEPTGLSLRYGDLHPTIVRVDARIESVAAGLAAATERAIGEIRCEYELALEQERLLQAELDAQMRRMAEASGQAVGAYVLAREAESHRGIYAALLERQNQLRVMRDTTENNAALLERADVPATPLVRSSIRAWGLAALLGLVLSVGLGVGMDFNDTIKTSDGLDRALQTPILSVFPTVRNRRSRRPGPRPGRYRERRGSRSDERLSLMSASVDRDFGEAVRMLRSALTLTGEAGSSRTVSVTSAAPGDGKTTVAVNLAMAFALGGAKVLLIDADMRRPSIHERLGLENATGLSQVIARQARLGDAIQATNDPHLFALTAGHLPPNPSELLGLVTMTDTTGSFDWVIVDTPPVLAVTDPVLVASHADEVVFVVSESRTSMSQAKHALKTLRAVGVRITGTVLNNADSQRPRVRAAA
jgi:capsular exopolysaccharide synthesis family protein